MSYDILQTLYKPYARLLQTHFGFHKPGYYKHTSVSICPATTTHFGFHMPGYYTHNFSVSYIGYMYFILYMITTFKGIHIGNTSKFFFNKIEMKTNLILLN